MDPLSLITPLVLALCPKALLLYGSYAQNLQDDQSDIDLLAFCEEIPPPDIRRKAYNSLSEVQILEIAPLALPQIHGWDNSWSPINDKLLVQSKKVEIGYNIVAWAHCIIERLITQHQTTCPEFPFRPYTFLGLLETCQPLYDPHQWIPTLRSLIRPIPEPLKEKIFSEFFPIFLEAREELLNYQEREIGILAYQFHLFRGIDALIQLLFILNDVYDPASKRIEPSLFKLSHLPPHFKIFITDILPRFYEQRREVSQFFEEALSFLRRQDLAKYL